MDKDQDLLFGSGNDGETGRSAAEAPPQPTGQPAGAVEHANLAYWEYDADGRVAFPTPADAPSAALPLLPRAVVRRTLLERATVEQIKGFYNLVDASPRYNARKQTLARELVAAAETDEDGGLGILATALELDQEGVAPVARWVTTVVPPPPAERAVELEQLLPLLQQSFDAETLLDLAFDLNNGIAEHGADEKAPTIAAKLVDEIAYAGRLDELQTLAFSLNPDAFPEEAPPTVIAQIGADDPRMQQRVGPERVVDGPAAADAVTLEPPGGYPLRYSETAYLRVQEESKRTAGEEVSFEYGGSTALGPNRLDLRALLAAASGDPRRYGTLLGDGVLTGEELPALVRRAIAGQVNVAREREQLHLTLDAADPLDALYWEVLHLPRGEGDPLPLSATTGVSFTRGNLALSALDPAPARPLRVLLAAVDQRVLDQLRQFETPTFPPLYPLEATLPMLQALLAPLEADGRVAVDVVSNLNSAQLTERLRDGYHVIHLLTHAVPYESGTRLVLADAEGGPQLVNADGFSWEDAAATLRLVTIAGAPSREENASPAQVAGRLLVRGVSACLAFQEPLTDGERQQFYTAFYTALLADGHAAIAASAGRAALYRANPEGWSWGGPALFVRGSDARLFDLQAAASLRVDFVDVRHPEAVPAGFIPEARVVLVNKGNEAWPAGTSLRVRALSPEAALVDSTSNTWLAHELRNEAVVAPGESYQLPALSFAARVGRTPPQFTVPLQWTVELDDDERTRTVGPTTTLEFRAPYQLSITAITLPEAAAPGDPLAADLQLEHAGGFTVWRQRDELALTATWQTVDGTPLTPPLVDSAILDEDADEPQPRFPLRGLTAPTDPGDYLLAVELTHRGQFGPTRAAYTTATPLTVRAPERRDFAVERVELPASLRPGAAATPTFHVRNSGNVAWTPDDLITIQQAGGAAIDVRPGLGVPPGTTVPLTHADLRLTVPEEQPAGALSLSWQLGSAAWGVTVTANHVVSITERLPNYAAALTVDLDLPPAAAWTRRRLRTPVTVTNAGARAWADGEAQLYFRQIRPDGALADEKTRPLSALAAGAATTVILQYDLADPGEITLAWQLLQGNGGAPQLLAEHTAAPLTIVAPEDLPLARLLDGRTFLDALPASLQARRLAALGRQLADEALTADARRDHVADELLPALLDDSAAVRRAALLALYALQAVDPAIDTLLSGALTAAPGHTGLRQTLRAAPPALAAWIDPLLPGDFFPPTEERPVTQIQLPPALQAPPPNHFLELELLEAENEARATYGNTEGRSPLDSLLLKTLGETPSGSSEAYGDLLFRCIFSDVPLPGGEYAATRAVYNVARNDAGDKLRIELRTSPALDAQRWEYLRAPDARLPLATFEGAPFYRRVGNRNMPPVKAAPLRILFAIASPDTLGLPNPPQAIAGLAKINVEQERDILNKDVGPLRDRGLVAFDLLDGTDGPVTMAALRDRLSDYQPHVVHIIAHGIIHETYGARLLLEDDEGGHNFARPEDFDEALLTREPLRLVVLAACQGARPGRMLQSFGRRLIQNGAAAVIAMQDNVKVKTAQLFNQRFYGDLLRVGAVDMALAATRYDLYHADTTSFEWGIPVLFLRASSPRLFDTDTVAAAALPRPDVNELDLRGYERLPGSDPTLEMVQRALEERAREVAQGNEVLVSAVRGALGLEALTAGGDAPLAKRQPKELLDVLNQPVALNWTGLKRFVEEDPDGSRLELPDAVYKQVVAALNTGKHLLLTGPPGTGKTSLAHDICRYARKLGYARGAALTTATADWTTFDTIGGYVPTRQQTLQFRPGTFLEAVSQGEWLVIDEMNRAEIDKAFGELFTVLSGQRVDLPYRVGETQVRIFPPGKGDAWRAAAGRDYDYVVHPSWRIIGTMNVYDKSYLYKMSFAFMRRFAFIDVDLPRTLLFQRLLDMWLEKAAVLPPQPVDDATADQIATEGHGALTVALSRLIAPKGNELMSRRGLGPAIFKDIIAYVGQRFSAEGGNHAGLLGFLGEAFQLYAAPQLDGLDREGIGQVYRFVQKELFAGLDDGTELSAGNPQLVLLSRIEMLYPHLQPADWAEFRADNPARGGGVADEGA